METIHFILFMVLGLGVDRLSSQILKRHKRNWIIASFYIDEGYDGKYPYTLDTIQTQKSLTLFEIHGQGVDEEPKNILDINKGTGLITVHGPVDYEQFKELKVVFVARDEETKDIDIRLGIEILIMDANDNAPQFAFDMYEISIKESTLQGTVLIAVEATDADSGVNKIFDLRIVSVTPRPEGLEFFLTQISETGTGTISFKGCLDHEKAEKYSIIVEAKDHGTKIQQSSSCTVIVNIEDGNNHLPVITQERVSGSVKEGLENVLVTRLQLTDKDSKGSQAWKARYEIQEDTTFQHNKHFRITTDPETNEGLLYVQKHLDFEESAQMDLTISVMNEIPYHICTVESRSPTGLWKVTTTTAAATAGMGQGLSTCQVTVTVLDVNEAPIFYEATKQVQLFENVKVGQYLVTFTARDPDVSSGNTIAYVKGGDPAGWVTVDAKTGKITTSKVVDRESVYVKDGIYVVTIYAVDDGEPPMTGTATLSIHVQDENDNAPSLTASIIDMCQSDGPSLAKITAMDLDDNPYGGPFSFKLLGDVEDKWKLEPNHGFSVNLVKENTVHSGHHEILLEVSDLQGNTAVNNLTVTVCNCLNEAKPDCKIRKSPSSTVGGGAFSIMFISILVLAGLLLLALLVSCNASPETKSMLDECPSAGQSLMTSNIEKPGNDCKVPFDQFIQKESENGEQIKTEFQQVASEQLIQGSSQSWGQINPNIPSPSATQPAVALSTLKASKGGSGMSQIKRAWSQRLASEQRDQWNSQSWGQINPNIPSATQPAVAISTIKATTGRSGMSQIQQTWDQTLAGYSLSSDQEIVNHRRILGQVLNTMMHPLHAAGELGDYAPRVYAEEGDAEHSFELDAISIPDISFDPNLNLDSRFSTLASICMPGESTAYNRITTCMTGKPQTATAIQAENHKTKMNYRITDYIL